MKGYEWKTDTVHIRGLTDHLNGLSRDGWNVFGPPEFVDHRGGEPRYLIVANRQIPKTDA